MNRSLRGPSSSLLRALARATMLCVIVVAVAGGILWTRLANGPLPLAFLKGAIASNMSASLHGFTTSFDDVTLVLGDEGFELQIENVRLTDDSDGTLVAVSPTAAISLSSAALWSGTIAAERIELVQPAMRLFYSRDDGIALSFSRAQQQRRGEAESSAPPSAARTRRTTERPVAAQPETGAPSTGRLDAAERTVFTPPPAGTGVIDLSRTLHRVVLANQNASATGYLRSFGLRAATLLIDDPEQSARLRVRRVRIDLTPIAGGNRVVGLVDIAEADGGILKVDARPAADAATTGLVDVAVAVEDLNPGAMARKVAALRIFAPIDALADFRSRLKLLSSGDVHSAAVNLSFKSGRLRPPGLGDLVVPLDTARFDVRYDRQRQRFDIGPSSIGWSGHRIGFIGAVTPDRSTRSDGARRELFDRWQFTVSGTEGELRGTPKSNTVAAVSRSGIGRVSATQLTAERRRYAIQTFAATGHFDMLNNAYVLEQAKLAIDEGQIVVSAAAATPDRPQGAVQGAFSGVTRDLLLAAWPIGASEPARAILERYILDGRVDKGRFSFGAGPGTGAQTSGLSLTARDVIFQAAKGLPALTAPIVELNVAADGVVSALAETAFVAGATRNGPRLAELAYVSARRDNGSGSVGEIALKFDMAAAELVEMMNVPVIRTAIVDTDSDQRIGPNVTAGRASGTLRVALLDASSGVGGNAPSSGPIVTGTLDLKGAAFTAPQVPFPVTDADLAFKLSDRLVDVTGAMRLKGVPVNVKYRRVFDVERTVREPVLLNAVLNREGRKVFGFDLGGVIDGDTPIEVRIPGFPKVDQADVVVDLTKAKLEFSSLGFLKQPGRDARLSFSVVPQDSGQIALQGLRLTGDRLAVAGEATVDAKGNLQAFRFPSFSLDLISRVALSGERREATAEQQPVWSVTATGPVLDGKGMFRSMTALGGSGAGAPAKADEPGLELEATFETILGFGDINLKQADIRLSKRAGQVVSMTARGRLSDGGDVTSGIEVLDGRRRLVVRSTNAGALLRMVKFYPNMRKGAFRLQLALDGGGTDVRRGTISIRQFDLVGDPIVSEVILAAGDPGRPAIARSGQNAGRVIREVLPFDLLTAEFSTGYGQLAISDARATGQVIGGSLRGKADFGKGIVNLGGTYSFLQPLNRLPALIPGLGQLLTGPRGEGMLGLNYAIKGPMSQPEVVVHPLSAVVPGIFREFFNLTPDTSQVVPRDETNAVGGEPSNTDGPAISAPAKIIGDWSATTRPSWGVDPFSER